ncbi:hypothetical protein [Klenkia terrae]|jgi:hypothetical protein|uniref:Uncharacterized protein n=1 Tax=Klenkia terrae TaxID=1052259 RepID=A0ABU8EEJ4_9ACTN|nr:hypothetical protein [Klenkia terrae]
MTSDPYVEELRSQLTRRHPDRTPDRSHDRDVARLLSPWRRQRNLGVLRLR